MSVRLLALAACLAIAGCTTTTTLEPEFSGVRIDPTPANGDASILDSKLERLNKLSEEYPKRSDYPYQIAGVYYQKENYKESAKSLERAIFIDPREAKYHYHLGRVYLKMRELNKAEASFRRSIDLMPGDRYTGGHAALGYVLCQKGDWEGARKEFEICASIDPKDATPYYYLGCIADLRKDREAAIANLKEYLQRGGATYRTKAETILASYGVAVAAPAPAGAGPAARPDGVKAREEGTAHPGEPVGGPGSFELGDFPSRPSSR